MPHSLRRPGCSDQRTLHRESQWGRSPPDQPCCRGAAGRPARQTRATTAMTKASTSSGGPSTQEDSYRFRPLSARPSLRPESRSVQDRRAVRLEQAARRAGAGHRVQRHRGGLRPQAQPDPRQGQPRPARAVGRRPRLRPQGRGPLHGLPAAQGGPRAARGRRRARRSSALEAFHDDDQLPDCPPPWRALPADQPLPRVATRRRPPTAARSPTCAAASCRRPRPRPAARAHRARRASGSTDRRDRTSATPSSSGGSCDANHAMAPEELTDAPGRRLRVTLPAGIPGGERQ